jgi:hypothetical protein
MLHCAAERRQRLRRRRVNGRIKIRGGGVRSAGDEVQTSEEGSEREDVEKPIFFRKLSSCNIIY